MDITFKTLTMRNFLSYGAKTTLINLDRGGTTLILGEDLDNVAAGVGGNGVGKTVIINALVYALYDKALSELKTAVQSATWNPTIRYHLGMAYYKKGFHREALEELNQSLKISNTFPEAEEAKALIDEIKTSRIKGTGKEVSMLQLSCCG